MASYKQLQNSVSWNCIQFGHFARYRIPISEWNFILSPKPFAISSFHVLRNSCVTSHKNVEICRLAKIDFERGKILKYFLKWGCAVVFGGIFLSTIAFEDFFCDQEFPKGTFFNFFSEKLSGETLCKLVQIFPPKVLVFKGEFFLSLV